APGRRSTRRRPVLPHLPRAVAATVHAVELDLILEGVHLLPEAAIAVREQLALCRETVEWLSDEFLALLDVVEDLGAHAEVPAVDPEARIAQAAEAGHEAAFARADAVKARRGRD